MKFMVGPESVPDGFRAIDTAYSTFYGTKNTASRYVWYHKSLIDALIAISVYGILLLPVMWKYSLNCPCKVTFMPFSSIPLQHCYLLICPSYPLKHAKDAVDSVELYS